MTSKTIAGVNSYDVGILSCNTKNKDLITILVVKDHELLKKFNKKYVKYEMIYGFNFDGTQPISKTRNEMCFPNKE